MTKVEAKAGPSSNWAKLQETLVEQPPLSNRKEKRLKHRKATYLANGSFRGRYNGVARYVSGTARDRERSSKANSVEAIEPEGDVVFYNLPSHNPLISELREMVAGRLFFSEAKKVTGNYLAVDCEMVGLGYLGSESALARVSLVNFHGHMVLDTFVAPRETVTDWRTWVSGVRPEDLVGAPSFDEVQKKVAKLVEGKILVGHALENDMKALLLDHPGPLTRDTQKYKTLRERAKTKHPGLRKLCEIELGLGIQKAAHSSVTDARATMALYRLHKTEWEQSVRHATEAWRKKHAPDGGGQKEKRKPDDPEDDAEEVSGESSATKKTKAEFPGGGRKGISSGLGTIVRVGGARIRGKVRGDGESREQTPQSDNKWWESGA